MIIPRVTMKNHLRIPDVPRESEAAMNRWFQKLYASGLFFNPDDRPEDIVVMKTGESLFTEQECLVLNASVKRLFEIHGDRVYDVALKYAHRAVGITPDYVNA